ncbi:FUSC family protein [Plantactinospora sp. S1510]|uniref:FUSC family protein n=1 Tax=Plantactinospora alkalitolerans TaxID=2789879 RepID=A0ABS0GRY6_9ACTN|nr:FUSC family protein [Plantactinospora alkalitolerans]
MRLRQLEIIAVIALQAGLAAALAGWLARDLLGNPNPVFAPTAAVGTIVAAIGQRTRRTLELLLGVALGLLIGDGLIFLLGSGPWQTGVIVTLAVGAALGLVGHAGTVVSQVGGTAVLIATLSSSERNLEIPRVVDAVTGSIVGLVVVALLLPLNPIRIVNRAAAPVLHILTTQLRETGRALRDQDPDRAGRALAALRSMSPDMERLEDAISGAEEVVTIAPARWRRRRDFEYYARGIEHLRHLINDCRGVARRVAISLQYREPLPDCLPDAVDALADSVWYLHRHPGSERTQGLTRRRALDAAEAVGRARRAGVGAYGDAIATQVRIAASDLIRVTGYPADEAGWLVGDAARRGESNGQAEEDRDR